jgi:hypothetical protein
MFQEEWGRQGGTGAAHRFAIVDDRPEEQYLFPEFVLARPRTVLVTPGSADALWKSRKNLFFKPTGGHGGKAVYCGDKVTKGVWAEITRGGYVAQTFGPAERAHDQGRRRAPGAQDGCPALHLSRAVAFGGGLPQSRPNDEFQDAWRRIRSSSLDLTAAGRKRMMRG